MTVRLPWRVGGRGDLTIYEQVRGVPTAEDRPIGRMDTPELAAAAVDAYNRCLLRDDTVAAEPWVPSAWEFVPTPRRGG